MIFWNRFMSEPPEGGRSAAISLAIPVMLEYWIGIFSCNLHLQPEERRGMVELTT